MNKKFLFLLVLFLLGGCGKIRDLYVFIPAGFEGSIVIEHNVKSSKNEMFRIADSGYVMFLKGKDLSYYTFKNDALINGRYNMRFFYYTDSTLCELERGVTYEEDSIRLGGITTGSSGREPHKLWYITVHENQQCKKDSTM